MVKTISEEIDAIEQRIRALFPDVAKKWDAELQPEVGVQYPMVPIFMDVSWCAFEPRGRGIFRKEEMVELTHAIAGAETDEAAAECFLAWGDNVNYGGMGWRRGEPCHDGGRRRLLRAYWDEAHLREPNPHRRYRYPDFESIEIPPFDADTALALLIADLAYEREAGTTCDELF